MRGFSEMAGRPAVLQRVALLPIIQELMIITKTGELQRLGDILNYAQLEVIAEAERQLAERGNIRIICLKARQMGLSTIFEAILFTLKFLVPNFRAMVISHDMDSAEHILGMTQNYWNTFIFRKYWETRYQAKKTLAWTDGGQIRIETAGSKGAGRSQTIHGLHASEVAFWDGAETLMTGLRNSVPNVGGVTCIFLESTANGVGGYFHRTWNAACRHENEFVPLFFPWWKHPEYTAHYLDPDMRRSYENLGNLDEEERTLRDQFHLGPDRLIWRRYAIKNLCIGGDAAMGRSKVSGVDQFHQEYPSTMHEAFISTGRNVYPLPQLLAHYRPQIGTTGRLTRDPAAATTRGVRFIPDPSGPLTIFRHPSGDTSWGVYQVGADPTHTTAGDYACAQVLNRRNLEQVAVLRSRVNPHVFAQHLELLGYYYNTATIAPEKEGPGYATVGALMAMNYPAVWESQKVDKTPGHVTSDTFGWSTNTNTKHLAIQSLLRLVAEPLVNVGGSTYGLVIHDEQTLTEMRDYTTTPDGQGYENADGSPYDDGVMALAICIATHLIDQPPPAYQGSDAIEMARNALQEAPKPAAATVLTGPQLTAKVGSPAPPPQPPPANPDDLIPAWEKWEDD